MPEGLTMEEMVFYGNYGRIEECDCCHKYFPVFNNDDDGFGFVRLDESGKYFYCCKCRTN